MKSFCYLVFIFQFVFVKASFAQLDSINTIEKANIYLKENPLARMITINTETDSSELVYKLSRTNDVVEYKGLTYKVVDSRTELKFRVSYIYFDSNKLSFKSIDSLRDIVINRYKSGVSFTLLAKEFNMDGNPNTDLGWSSEGYLVKEFQESAIKHKMGEIFKVDVKEKGWYYVVLKPYDNKTIKLMQVIQF